MKIKLSRRKFLTLTIGLASLSVMGIASGYYYSSQRRLISKILKTQFPIVKMDKSLIDEFTADFVSRYKLDHIATIKYSIRQNLRYFKIEKLLLPVTPWLDKFVRNVVTDFIKTTDFLEISDPSTRSPEFLGYNTVCTNQFAQFD